ncbi:MAG TPA: GNAT family N-acetyltransferase [Bacteroidota bacterium]|nr:GNAT family N-acetyltransferase [Bacteroidota bacterium]
MTESYRELLSTGEPFWQLEKENWRTFDDDVYANPDTIGQCVFLTHLEAEIIGFSSFDPRGEPLFGVIGHNRILPRFRGQGFGRQQVLETLRRLKMRGIRKAVVSTSEHPFFIPARRMYVACGFRETKRCAGRSHFAYQNIEFEKELK